MFISANFSPHRFAISAQANDKLETAGVSADILMGDVFHTPQKYWSYQQDPSLVCWEYTDRSLLGDYHQHYDLSKILVVSQKKSCLLVRPVSFLNWSKMLSKLDLCVGLTLRYINT